MAKLSIIIPAYNVEKHIYTAVNSVLCQSFQDFEIICIDDCSTDNTYSILLENFSSNEKIQIIRNKKNLGLGIVRNIGFSLAKGEYITSIDSDDIICDKDLYKTAIERLDNTQVESLWYKFNIFWEEANKTTTMEPLQSTKEGIYSITPNNIADYPMYTWNKIFRNDSLSENIFFRGNCLYEDFEFYFRYYTQNPNVYIMDKIGYTWQQREDSISGSICKNIENHKDRFRAIENIYQFLVEKELLQQYKKSLLKVFYNNFKELIHHKEIEEELIKTANLCLKNINFTDDYLLEKRRKST